MHHTFQQWCGGSLSQRLISIVQNSHHHTQLPFYTR